MLIKNENPNIHAALAVKGLKLEIKCRPIMRLISESKNKMNRALGHLCAHIG